jgi:hypothetical protein
MLEVLKQLVEALELPTDRWNKVQTIKINEAIKAGRDAIAELEKQEPVAWARFSEKGNLFDLLSEPDDGYTPLYTSPQPRKPLTPESPCEMTQAENKMFKLGWLECEAAHGIKE